MMTSAKQVPPWRASWISGSSRKNSRRRRFNSRAVSAKMCSRARWRGRNLSTEINRARRSDGRTDARGLFGRGLSRGCRHIARLRREVTFSFFRAFYALALSDRRYPIVTGGTRRCLFSSRHLPPSCRASDCASIYLIGLCGRVVR